MLLKGHKYRIYPSAEQAILIDKHFDYCRLIWNLALEVKISVYRSTGRNLSVNELHKQITDLKKEFTWLNDVCAQSLQSVVRDLDKTFTRFFNGYGFPRFKKKKGRQSYKYPQATSVKGKFLNVPKIKNISIVLSRPIEGTIRNITISKTPTGKYFAGILISKEQDFAKPPKPVNALGIDLGLTTFATLSTGVKIKSPKYLTGSSDRLKVLHQRARRKKAGSKNSRKAFKRLAVLHEKISNKRSDFLHKLSTKIIRDKQTDTICVEGLAVINLIKNHCVANSIADASWSKFVRLLEYKAKWHGKNFIKLSRWVASSKICSNCGQKNEQIEWATKEWDCPKCNCSHDRDINAAINIRNLGMGNPIGPVELPAKVGAKKQEPVIQ